MLADPDGAAAPLKPVAGAPATSAARAAPVGDDRVPASQKIGFGLGSFLDMWGHWLYQSLAFHVFNVFLGVAPGLISTALGLKIFVDAVSDALFGWLSDNTRTRWGRRRPFLAVGSFLTAMVFPWLWRPPVSLGETGTLVYLVVVGMVFYTCFSCWAMKAAA